MESGVPALEATSDGGIGGGGGKDLDESDEPSEDMLERRSPRNRCREIARSRAMSSLSISVQAECWGIVTALQGHKGQGDLRMSGGSGMSGVESI